MPPVSTGVNERPPLAANYPLFHRRFLAIEAKPVSAQSLAKNGLQET